MAQLVKAICPIEVSPADADTIEIVKRQVSDQRFNKSIQILPENEHESTSSQLTSCLHCLIIQFQSWSQIIIFPK